MKSNRNRAFLKNVPTREEKNWFAIGPILPNIIAIIIIIGAYWYVYSHYLFIDYTRYIYWTMNVLVTYNIVAASARSFVAPVLAVVIALATYFTISAYGFSYLTTMEFWQLLIVGIIGFFIAAALKL